MKLKPLLITIFLMLLTYSAYWYYIAQNAEKHLSNIVHDLKKDGISLSYESLTVEGFPYRLVLVLEQPQITSVNSNLKSHWSSDKLNIYAQPWNFKHLIFTANSSRLLVDNKSNEGGDNSTIVIDSNLMRLSVNKPTNQQSRISLELNEVNSSREYDNTPLFSSQKIALHTRNATLETSEDDSNILAPKLMDIAVGLEGFTFGDFSNKKIDEITMVSNLRGEVKPNLSREGLVAWRDSGGTLEVSQMDIVVGVFDLNIEGSLTLDEQLRPLGALSTRIDGAEAASEVVDRFVSLNPEARTTLVSSLTLLEAFSGGEGIPLSLTAQNGAMWLGPLRITGLSPIID